jgi:hypothetical protein
MGKAADWLGNFPKNYLDFRENIFAFRAQTDYHRAIGATMSRLHGFHRFLPHLWELFYCNLRRTRHLAA